MTKGRLEAFTDGVMAVIITIMVLELKTIWVVPDRRIEARAEAEGNRPHADDPAHGKR